MTDDGFSIVVATDLNRGIGVLNQLPWKLKGDMAYFKKLTQTTTDFKKKNMVIMGRKTWESIPDTFRPLACRINVVLSRQRQVLTDEDTYHQLSLDEALLFGATLKNQNKVERIFVIGGAQIYQLAVQHPLCQRIYQTTVYHHYDCDAFFPEHGLEKVNESFVDQENGVRFSFDVFG